MAKKKSDIVVPAPVAPVSPKIFQGKVVQNAIVVKMEDGSWVILDGATLPQAHPQHVPAAKRQTPPPRQQQQRQQRKPQNSRQEESSYPWKRQELSVPLSECLGTADHLSNDGKLSPVAIYREYDGDRGNHYYQCLGFDKFDPNKAYHSTGGFPASDRKLKNVVWFDDATTPQYNQDFDEFANDAA